MLKKILIGVSVLLGVIVAFGLFRTFTEPKDLWINTKVFPACPERPSCVSSAAADDVHRIEPISFAGDTSTARATLEKVITAMPDTRIVHSTPEYLHVLFLTPKMRFHDDVELLVETGFIQVRSMSRFGYRDHGVNRARVEALRAAFAKASGVLIPQ